MQLGVFLPRLTFGSEKRGIGWVSLSGSTHTFFWLGYYTTHTYTPLHQLCWHKLRLSLAAI
jgi:hypothetical protein